ncbi:FAD-dependent oxidoreductase [Okeania sp. SIO2B9]|uniref:FAD-dependent oxidoreductase n=1 Tax=Okeania sp. SIO2B9 TaxID=2607782 RepID=UPI00142ACE6B|nr:FAD-dependent oxidoreductase [Okeania sp. SIO2B9]NES92883.1 FAD-dependent oxidoreductase [Okeania sp. SIO2B9]
MSNSILDDRFFTRPTDGQIFSFPILIVGGSTAAYSATLGALKAGANVCLVQPKQILGGQFTTQALPASTQTRCGTRGLGRWPPTRRSGRGRPGARPGRP